MRVVGLGRDAGREDDLAAEVARLGWLARPDMLGERKSAAQAANNEKITAYVDFVRQHIGDLVAEIVPEAQKVSADMEAIIEKVKPIEDAYERFTSASVS